LLFLSIVLPFVKAETILTKGLTLLLILKRLEGIKDLENVYRIRASIFFSHRVDMLLV